MDATLYTIQDRSRHSSAAFARPEHFTLDEGQTASPTIVLEEPGWTPYCLDDANRRVLFVQTPPEVDLAQAAFMYSAQFEHARRALAVPYPALELLAPSAPIPERMIFVHSMGRCGSTVMSQVLNQIEGVYSLSEPDVYTDLNHVRRLDVTRNAELSQVLRAVTLLLFPHAREPRPSTLALKFRSHAIGLADMLHEQFPNARNLFMYRNAVSWAQSVYRFLQRLNYPNELPREDALNLFLGYTGENSSYAEPYLDADAPIVHAATLLAPTWLSYLDRCMTNYERGVPFHTVRYEDLNERREETLRAALAYSGLPATQLEQAMRGFEKDSQEGTDLARTVRADDLPPERIEQFLEILSRHSRFGRPDYILPSTPPATA